MVWKEISPSSPALVSPWQTCSGVIHSAALCWAVMSPVMWAYSSSHVCCSRKLAARFSFFSQAKYAWMTKPSGNPSAFNWKTMSFTFSVLLSPYGQFNKTIKCKNTPTIKHSCSCSCIYAFICCLKNYMEKNYYVYITAWLSNQLPQNYQEYCRILPFKFVFFPMCIFKNLFH